MFYRNEITKNYNFFDQLTMLNFLKIPLLLFALLPLQLLGQTDFHEAENTNKGNVNVSSTYSGYSGSGYVTGITSEWSYLGFDKSNSETQAAQIVIRYANGHSGNVTHLSLNVGSGKVADLVFPTTGDWSTWADLVVDFSLPVGYQNVKIDAMTNASNSVNIDYLELRLGDDIQGGGGTPTPTPPGSFNQIAPSANAIDIALSPNLSWGSSSDADDYTLVVSANSNLSSPIVNTTVNGTSYQISGLNYQTQYYWEVTANNADGNTVANNAVLSFTTVDEPTSPTPPGSFSLTAPSNGAADQNTSLTLQWSASSDATSYQVKVSTNSNLSGSIVDQTTSSTSLAISGLVNSTTYYWGVTASNSDGSVDASNQVYSFTTEDAVVVNPPPSSGEIFEAENMNKGNCNVASSESGYSGTGYIKDFVSEWSSAKFEQSYNDDTPAVLNIRYSNGSGQTINNIDLKVGSAKVQDLSFPPTNGWGDWQILTTDAFTIPAGYQGVELDGTSNVSVSVYIDYVELLDGSSVPPSSFSLISPANNAIDVLPSVQLSWNAASGADSYTVLVDNNSDFSSPVYNQQLTVTNCQPTGLDYSTTYYWKVSATNSNGTTEGGSRSFTTSDPLPLPGAFSHTSPSDDEVDVATNVSFTWGSSSDASSYAIKVSTNSNLSNPLVDVSGITATSYSANLSDATTYYWQVTATNPTGSTSSTKTQFTTLVPPPPGSFSLSAPSANAQDVSRFPQFNWSAASAATSYHITVDDNANFSSPVIDQSGITSTSYSSGNALDASKDYYWKVVANNSVGSTNASNNGIKFTTGDVVTGSFYVSTSGSDANGNGSAGNPWKTLAYAVSQIPAGQNNTLHIAAGTYVETQPVKVPLGVNLEGAGVDQVTITSAGSVPVDAGVDVTSGDWKLWYHGSLIQLYSGGYQGGDAVLYGSPDEMIPSSNGNQYLTGFTVDGANKQVKAGIWVQNRNNVTMHHVKVQNCEQRGAVFTRSDLWWYEPMPEGMWMHNSTIHDVEFINNGAQLGSETLGNLCLAGLDGADIYNITINDNVGYGIKFIMVGHYRNVKIHDCDITVNEQDAAWGEKISIELWNLDQGNEVYNINCNTWHSYVNHGQITEYEPTGDEVNNLKIRNVVMIDEDGSSGKEAIEAALSGVEISDCYFQDKGFGIAIWNGQGQTLKKNFLIKNNIINNVARQPNFGFGNSAAVFIPDPATNVMIYNNVFDKMGVALDLGPATNVDIKNNIFYMTEGDDVKGGSGSASHNLKYHSNSQKAAFNSSLSGSNNVSGNPGLVESGNRVTTFYEPASNSSLVVDAGTDIGDAFSGSAPDIGRWEYNSVPTQVPGSFSLNSPSNNANDVSVTPALTWGAALYAQSYQVDVATNSSFGNIVYTQSGITDNSHVVTAILDNNKAYYWRVRAINVVGNTNASNNGQKFTTEDVTPAPGGFTLNSPSGNGVSKTPQFSWNASSDAASYTVVVSTQSNFSNPTINQSGIATTSFTPTVPLNDETTYYWKVSAVNVMGTADASNNGLSFTTVSGPLVGDGLVNLEKWDGIEGDDIVNLTSHVNYPNYPDAVSKVNSTQTPSEQGSDFGQRLWGYLLPTVTGSYEFAVSGDDDVELWLSTDAYKANKVRVAYFDGWTYAGNYDKYPTQKSGGITLEAGKEYYFEVLHKEKDGGDHAQMAWKKPGDSVWSIVSGNVLSSYLLSNLPAPEAFTLSAPTNASNGVSRVPTFTWTASNLATSYDLVVSTNSNLSNPIVDARGLETNSYTVPTTDAFPTSTTYYWAVTAVNEGGTLEAGNNTFSFTTEAQPLPGDFSIIQPTDGVTGTSWNPFFTWSSSFEADSYTIVVSENSNLSSPVINESGITSTGYTDTNSLSATTKYYWKVTAVNSSGSTDVTGGVADFTTGNQDGLVHVKLSGNDGSGNGTASNPYRTVAYAASQVVADQGKTIFVHPGEFIETSEIQIPTGVNLLGSGEGVTILKAGNLGSGGGKEDYVGSLIQLISPSYVVDQYSPAVAPANGNQTISGFTIDGSNRSLKAGLWLQARDNVTIHHVTIQNTAQRGAVACFGQKQGREEPPYYIKNLVMHDMSFIDAAADLSDESLGNLNIAHTDGAEIYNIDIDCQYGYGIKFIFEGYYKNTKIHDCTISVNEDDPLWTEDIAIELWNLGPGNEVYRLDANTWFSFVNWANTFNNPASAGAHLKVYDCKIIDNDGTSLKEAIEVACSGTEVYGNYIENKGWGIAQWLQAERKVTIRNNIFRNTQPQAVWADAGAIFIVADEVPKMEDIKIHNNVFDNLVTGGGSPLKVISVWKGTVDGLDIANNVSTNMLAENYDFYLYGAASVSNATYRNNMRDVTHNVTGITSQSGNLVANPQFKATGQRWEDYYAPATSNSNLVDAGVDIGHPYNGSSPDIGAYEYGSSGSRTTNIGLQEELEVLLIPNPANDYTVVSAPQDVVIENIQLLSSEGKVMRVLSPSNEDVRITTGNLPSGLYFVMLHTNEGAITKKLIVR